MTPATEKCLKDSPACPCEVCGCPRQRWLRVNTVAKQFGCSAKKVRRLVKCGALDGVLLGGEWRIDHQSLDEYVRRDSARHFCPIGGEAETNSTASA